MVILKYIQNDNQTFITTINCILCRMSKCTKMDYFSPGKEWKDNTGIHINAHGGELLFYKGVYCWYGEHKITGRTGTRAQVGVCCYS